MEFYLYLRAFFALLFILGLISLCAFIGKRYLTRWGYAIPHKNNNRLRVQESLLLDTKHKLVIVKADSQEWMMILGPSQPTIVPLLSVKDSPSLASTPEL